MHCNNNFYINRKDIKKNPKYMEEVKYKKNSINLYLRENIQNAQISPQKCHKKSAKNNQILNYCNKFFLQLNGE